MAANHANVINVAGSAPIGISNYIQVIAALTFAVTQLVLANSTDTNITLAIGAAGSEVDYVCVAAGTTLKLNLSLNVLQVGMRLACIAEGAASTKGQFTVSLVP